jgi:hypothetical protein
MSQPSLRERFRQAIRSAIIVIVIVVIAIGILIRPEVLSNIQEFGFGGLSVKMRNRLENLENAQENQTKELDELRFALLLMVTDSERVHLENLRAGSNPNYDRNPSVQAELRRLRAMGLIRSKRYIGEMPEHFNLSEWVELTDRGNEYLRRTAEQD